MVNKKVVPQQPHASLATLQADIGYTFNEQEHLIKALTHRSQRGQKASYERLEFLGDSIIGFVVADHLFRQFPTADEGALTRARAQIVRRETLAASAQRLDLGRYLILGPGELRSGGHRRQTILSDVIEAIVAAVFLDRNLEAARSVVERVLAEPLQQVEPGKVEKDAKTILQEFLQQDGRPLPDYILEKEEGPDHQRMFTVRCVVDKSETTGVADARRRAEQQAAAAMIQLLGVVRNA